MNTDGGTEVPCGCGPTESERRALWGPVTRRAALAAGVIGAAALSISGFSQPALAYNPDDYPSWGDVSAAKKSQSAKAAEVKRIEGLISQLTQRVAEAQAKAKAAADAYYEALEEFYEAGDRAKELQGQADEKSETAETAALAAARLAAQLTRSGGEDTSLNVLFADSAENADDLLAKLGQMDKLAEQNDTIYAEAASARDAAQALSDQAEVARKERDRLQKVAEQKMKEAQAAQREAEEALAQQEKHLDTLEAQLAALKDETSKTVSEYEKGVAAKKKHDAAMEKKRQEELARNNNSGGGGGGGGGGAAPPPPSTGTGGWVRPSGGRHTSGYGPRMVQCGSGYCASGYHRGVDMAAGCGSPIRAAHAGTVSFAGYNGGYGNYVRIEHGHGIGTGYGHQVRIVVWSGQRVSAGQVIGYEGNTGNSFGCHLHFEVYQNGYPINPQPFMAARGISV